jgi:hypothetical protein
MNNTTPTRANVVILKQMLNLIPRGLINRHALETGVEAKARSFSVVSHLSSMLFAQLSHANCMDWAKHRRRKAAAKMHLRLDLHSFLPSFAIVDTAGQHDNKRAREVCATIQPGEIVVFDKAYVDFDHLFDLDQRGVWWVTRSKGNMKYRAVKNHPTNDENILKDQTIALQGRRSALTAG